MNAACPSFVLGALFGLLTLVSTGCCGPEKRQLPDYDNSFWNVTSARIDDVRITWQANGKTVVQSPGDIDPATYHYVGQSMAAAPLPIPEIVSVSWKTADGKAHEQTVNVASRIPDIKHFDGSIFYKFSAEGVAIVPRSYAEQEKNVKADKAAVP